MTRNQSNKRLSVDRTYDGTPKESINWDTTYHGVPMIRKQRNKKET